MVDKAAAQQQGTADSDSASTGTMAEAVAVDVEEVALHVDSEEIASVFGGTSGGGDAADKDGGGGGGDSARASAASSAFATFPGSSAGAGTDANAGEADTGRRRGSTNSTTSGATRTGSQKGHKHGSKAIVLADGSGASPPDSPGSSSGGGHRGGRYGSSGSPSPPHRSTTGKVRFGLGGWVGAGDGDGGAAAPLPRSVSGSLPTLRGSSSEVPPLVSPSPESSAMGSGMIRVGSIADYTKAVAKAARPHGRVQLISDAKGTVNSIELYFDLIFVAAMFRLGTMYSDDYKSKVKDSHMEMTISFCVLWLTWHHVNMLYTRFSLDDNWKFVEYLIMLLALLLSVVMVTYEVQHCPDASNSTAATLASSSSCVISTSAALNSTCSCASPTSAAGSASSLAAAAAAACVDTVWARPAVATPGFMLTWAASRLVNAIIYFVGGLQNTSARKMTFWYSVCLLTSVVLLCISAAVGERDGYLAVAVIVIVLETMMYPIAIVMTNKADHLPIDVHHNIERAELWAILVLGESMLSLVHGSAQYIKYANAEFYLVIAIAFTINFVLLKIYINSTPEPSSHDHRVPDLDTHAIDLSLIRSVFFDISQGVVTAFLFIFGVAIKFVVKYGHYKDGSYYAQDYAEMFSIGAGFSLLTMTLSRLTHEWTDYPVCGEKVTRIRLWWVHLVMSGLIIALPYFTIDRAYKEGYSKYERTGISPLAYLVCVLVCVLTAVAADYISRSRPESLIEDLAEYAHQTEQLKQGKLPDDISSDDIDADKVAKNTRQALNVSNVRNPGGKQMRFSGRYMVEARRLRKTMDAFGTTGAGAGAGGPEHASKALGAWRKNSAASAPVSLGSASPTNAKPSLFSAFKSVVDEQDPTHVMGSKNLAMKNWKIGLSKTSIARQFNGGHNSGGVKLSLGKGKKVNTKKVAPAPCPTTSDTTAGLASVPQEPDQETDSVA